MAQIGTKAWNNWKDVGDQKNNKHNFTAKTEHNEVHVQNSASSVQPLCFYLRFSQSAEL